MDIVEYNTFCTASKDWGYAIQAEYQPDPSDPTEHIPTDCDRRRLNVLDETPNFAAQMNTLASGLNGSVDESGRWLKFNPLSRIIALNLAESQHAQIHDMLLSNHPPAEVADVATCGKRSVFAI